MPIIIVLVIYAIPIVPTWCALKRKKASFGAFLGWIVGEIILINLGFYLLATLIPSGTIQYNMKLNIGFDFFELYGYAIIFSVLIFLFLPSILKIFIFKNINLKAILMYFFLMIAVSTIEITLVLYDIARGVGQLGNK